MSKTIVVGIDGSRNAEDAVRAAVDLVEDDQDLHIVHACRPISENELRAIGRDLPEEYRSLLHGYQKADSVIDSARSIVRRAGVEAEFHEVNDDPTDALLGAVERFDADLLVVGSRGENLSRRLMHGSVSTKLLHHCPCSMLVVKEGAHHRAD